LERETAKSLIRSEFSLVRQREKSVWPRRKTLCISKHTRRKLALEWEMLNIKRRKQENRTKGNENKQPQPDSDALSPIRDDLTNTCCLTWKGMQAGVTQDQSKCGMLFCPR